MALAPLAARQTAEDSQTKKGSDTSPLDLPLSPKPTSVSEIDGLSGIAAQLVQIVGKTDCQQNRCVILVTDFVCPDGKSSLYGKRLADALGDEIGKLSKSIKVTDRSSAEMASGKLRADRVPGSVWASDPMLVWLGSQVNASFVLGSQIVTERSGQIKVSSHLLKVNDGKLLGGKLNATVLASPSAEEFAPIDLPPLEPLPETLGSQQIYRAGANGVGMPRCTHMPNPPYSDEARRFRISGVVLVEAIVRINGSVQPLRIVRGLPFGLNENTVETMLAWRCSPAELNAEPVPTYVPFEVTFRLY